MSDPSTSAPPQDTSGSAGALIDVDVDQFLTGRHFVWVAAWSLFVVFSAAVSIVIWAAVVGYGVVTLLAALGLSDLTQVGRLVLRLLTILMIALAAAPVIAIFIWKSRRNRAEAAEFAAESVRRSGAGAPDKVATHIVGNLHKMQRAVLPVLEESGASLVSQDLAGTTVRVCPATRAWAVEPLVAPVEPLRLDDADNALDDLVEAGPETDDADGPPPDNKKKQPAAARGLRSSLAVLKIVAPVFFALLFVAAVGRSVQAGRVTPGAVLWGMILVSQLPLVRRHLSMALTEPKWLVVCGGLVWRPSRWLGLRRDLHLFDRRKSVLFVFQNLNGSWVFAVADDRHKASSPADESGIRLLLRAWLSPAPPPRREELEQLFADGQPTA